MSLEADALVDRRRLKRRLAVWRALAILAFVAALLIGIGRFGVVQPDDYVARYDVTGIIRDDTVRDELFAQIGSDERAKALIVRINSPGGTVVGGESLYLGLREIAAKKPVVALMGTLATSAAYMGALASDRIFAREGTLTGSIGVLVQAVEITELLEDIGVSAELVKSAPLKASPSLLEPMSEKAREATRGVVMDMYEMFVDLVAERRDIERPRALALADGRVYTGRQALETDLVDAIGGQAEARTWLAEAHDVSEDLPVRDIKPKKGVDALLEQAAGSAKKALFSERLVLDGLISVWHPGLL
jgi:protease-4